MALANTTVKAIYNGNGSTTDFAIPFTILIDDSAETQVYTQETSDTPDTYTLKTENVDYTLTGAPDADSFHTTVRFGTAPSSTTKVIVIRAMPLTQTLDLNPVAGQQPESLEKALDRVVAQVQELDEKVDRAVKSPVGTTVSEANLTLPEPVANNLLGWNAAGTKIINVTPGSVATAGSGGISSTTDVPEGTNLYYTNGRADARIAAANLDALNDVSVGSPATGDMIRWSGSAWAKANGLTTKGDLLTYSTSVQRLAVGTNGKRITAQSGSGNGLDWLYDGVQGTVTTSIAINTSYDVVALSNTISPTLPDISSASMNGKKYVLVHQGTSLTDVITITCAGSDVIWYNGASTTTFSLYTKGESLTVVADGGVWYVVAHNTINTWATYSPTWSAGFGTVASTGALWRRVGDTIDIDLWWTNGTVAASVMSITLPPTINIDATKLTRANTSANPGHVVGQYAGNGASVSGFVVTATGTSATLLYLGGINSSAVMLTPANGTVALTGSVMSAQIRGLPVTNFKA